MTIIFDIDGTLVDSTKRHVIVLKKALIDNQIPFDETIVDSYVEYKNSGNNTKIFLKEVLKLDSEMCYCIANLWQEKIENDENLLSDTLYFDTIAVLEKLYKKHKIIFLSARKNQPGLVNELTKLDILKYCNKLFVVDPCNAPTKKMEVVKELLLDSTNKDIIVVGDTEVDNFVAEALNIKKYILNRGFRSKLYWDKINEYSYNNLFNLEEVINEQLSNV